MGSGRSWPVWALLAAAALAGRLPAQVPEALTGDPKASLAGGLRGLFLEFLPNPLFEDNKRWGGQKLVNEIRWRGKGFGVHPEKVQVPKNDGLWERVRVTAPRLPDTLVVDVRDLRELDDGRTQFAVFISFDADVDYERQRWDEGIRLFSAGVRARLRVRLMLVCESTLRTERKGTLLPDLVFRLRVLGSNVGFDNLVFEHVAGIGGDGAELIGEASRSFLKLWRPSLERHLLDRAGAAIVKAGDTKEVRLTLSKLGGK